MVSTYQHIVLGCGGVGSAAAYWLGERAGDGVLAVEQYRIGHDRGASEDHSRIIRHAYHSPVYGVLTEPAYAHWRLVEQRTGLALVHRTGGLHLAEGTAEGERELAAYAGTLAGQGHDHELLTGVELRRRWPQWTVDDHTIALYQKDSGILDIRKAGAAHVALARQHGVTFLPDTPVRGIESHAGQVAVHTDREEFRGSSLTICAGAWTPDVLDMLDVALPITLTQEQVTYFATPNLRDFAPDRFPVWVHHGARDTFYGFPVYGEVAVKAARDMSGEVVTQRTRRWTPDPARTAEVARFLDDHLPGARGPELLSKTCVYDLPPDRDFVLGHLPGHPRITMFVGAGHGAKFAGLFGHILADLAVDGGTEYPVSAFRADRPALTDPGHPRNFRLGGARHGGIEGLPRADAGW